MHKVFHVKAKFVKSGTPWKESEIDGDRLASDLAATIANAEREGYRILSVTPVESAFSTTTFSYTGGLVVVAYNPDLPPAPIEAATVPAEVPAKVPVEVSAAGDEIPFGLDELDEVEADEEDEDVEFAPLARPVVGV